jgi:hypothetical protein
MNFKSYFQIKIYYFLLGVKNNDFDNINNDLVVKVDDKIFN